MPVPAVMAGISAASSMLGPLIGMLQGVKGPKKKRQEEEQQRLASQQQQLAGVNQANAPNAQAVAGGGTLPLPSPPVLQQTPVALPAPPQVQLQQQSPLGRDRNNYMMKLLMQGNR